MTWNFNMNECPKGNWETTEFEHKGEIRERNTFKPHKLLTASECGKVIPTSYLPKEERFEFYTKESPPIAWQEYPKHPHKVNRKV